MRESEGERGRVRERESERVRDVDAGVALAWHWAPRRRHSPGRALTRRRAHRPALLRRGSVSDLLTPTIHHLKCLANFCMASDNDSGPVYCEYSGTKWCWILPYLKVVKHEMHQPQGHHNTFGLSGEKVFGWVTLWNNGYHKRLLSLLRLV